MAEECLKPTFVARSNFATKYKKEFKGFLRFSVVIRSPYFRVFNFII